MGREWHFPVLAQSFSDHARLPWPSKVPPPEIDRPSMFWKRTQDSELILLGSAGALMVPWTCKVMDLDLQGPWNCSDPAKYVPLGITTVLGAEDWQACFHELMIA